MNEEYVTVVAGGGIYSGFEKVQVRAGIDQASRSFGIQTTEMAIGFGSSYNFPPGTPIQILANGDLLLNGFVNMYRPVFDKHKHHVEIEGRCRAQDWVDSSAKHPKSSWKQKTPDQIAQELNKSGIGITAKVPLTPDDWALYQGETGFKTIERMLRHQRATQMGTANGDIEITNASVAMRMGGALIEGHNITRAAGQLSDMRRFGETEVKGQSRKGKGDQSLRVNERYHDGGVKRERHKTLIHEGDTTKSKAQKRAKHEAERAQGFSVRADIYVQGFRDDFGMLWQPNFLVLVESPMLKIFGDMLIESVLYSQDEKHGTITQLQLVHPLAYGGSAGGVGQSDAGWGAF
jgi:prophage tail gpP-like protein